MGQLAWMVIYYIREDYYYVCNVTLTDMISDHTILYTKLAINKPGLPEKKASISEIWYDLYYSATHRHSEVITYCDSTFDIRGPGRARKCIPY